MLKPTEACCSIPSAWSCEDHICINVISEIVSPPVDLWAAPLYNPKLILFVDGFYAKNSEEKYQLRYDVTTNNELIDKETLT